MNIYVGNLNYGLQEDELRQIFSEFGEVDSVKIIKDKATGRAKGFGFVEMTEDNDANNAIEELNGAEVMGRSIRVSKARPMKSRDSY
jgi:RNA recognition motif-containing protein